MTINVYSISILFSVLFLIIVIELVRKNKLQERYSLLWILMSLILILLSSTPAIINTFAKWLDIKNPPSLLFLFGMVYLIIYSLNTTTVVSKQSDKIIRLTQEVALLSKKIDGVDAES